MIELSKKKFLFLNKYKWKYIQIKMHNKNYNLTISKKL